MKATAEEWDKVWSSGSLFNKFLNKARYYFSIKLFEKVFKEYVNKKSDLLEVGCGSSTTSLFLSPKICSFTGVDISEEALSLSRKNAKRLNVKNARFIKGDCFKLPFKDNQFDIVWSQGLIEHFDNDQGILKEKIRVCKKGGIIITSVPAYWSYHKVWYILTRPKFLRRFWPWTDQTFYTKKRLNSLIKHENVAILKIFNYFLFGVIIQVLKKR